MILSLTLPIRRNSFSKKKKTMSTHVIIPNHVRLLKLLPPRFALFNLTCEKPLLPSFFSFRLVRQQTVTTPVFYIIKPRKGRERQREESSSASLTPRVLVSSWAKKSREIERERERRRKVSSLSLLSLVPGNDTRSNKFQLRDSNPSSLLLYTTLLPSSNWTLSMMSFFSFLFFSRTRIYPFTRGVI